MKPLLMAPLDDANLRRHPNLKGKLAMRGGTAINIFMLDIFRFRMFSERSRRPEHEVRRLVLRMK